jgi:hypothetical protein
MDLKWVFIRENANILRKSSNNKHIIVNNLLK